MEDFLTFLSVHSSGITVLVLILFSFILMINWLARIFGWGKYRRVIVSGANLDDKNSNKDSGTTNTSDNNSNNGYGNIVYMVTQFFANLINDFKHFLALIIVIIFAGLIVFSMTTTDDFNNKMEALQLVIASLGGIVGTVIGYYFGESAAKSNSAVATTAESNVVQLGTDGDVMPAPNFEIDNNE